MMLASNEITIRGIFISAGNAKMTESKSAEVKYAAEKHIKHSVHKISSEPSPHLITGDKETGHSWTTHV